MGFKAYRVTSSESGHLLEMPEPIRFSGPNGLVARWYRANRLNLDDRPAIIPASEWLAMDFGTTRASDRWIILEQASGANLRYARLEAINGLFGQTTRLVLRFIPLEKVAGSAGLVLREPAVACGWSEELSIDGGSDSSSCTWRWRAPTLGFASVNIG